MTAKPKRGSLADLPLVERREQQIEKQREISDGLMCRHVADSAFQRVYLATQLARVLQAGPALAAKLRGG